MDRYTFLFPMGDMMITLKDVYQILRMPIEGELIIVAINRIMIRFYVGVRCKIWDIFNGGVLIKPLYQNG